MECLICKNGNTEKGFDTLSFEKNGHLIIVKNVPGEVSNNCGHFYIDEIAAIELQKKANRAIEDGAELEIMQYA